ncbi:protein-glutamine gamma-glutamyltransferase [Mesobacillus zeae]|uniref:Protein-glutamine gamma-glutamyltransferase n=1 Tax=Mesobacillus zeae TaxID=1917180 RepID=A0A398BJ15_9BACI|nr:protein-glutamine gamma-glutamyltransferase [Mesobacillus zeae]RID87770.1 protein-glutamine gamma-glutamyltransferase [Mesobacillus zeae]
MITFDGNQQGIDSGKLRGSELIIYRSLETARHVFIYQSAGELMFDIVLRKNIIESSRNMLASGAAFTSFQYSSFNPAFWSRTDSGYLLRPDVLPSDAVRDVYINGKSYGFECSTAMVLIFYKAVLESIRESDFNYLFGGLLVWNWHHDPDLAIITMPGTEFIPGDVIYFNNPEFKESIWRGENAVLLENGQFYGHGVGIASASEIIAGLNSLRREGAVISAYMLDQHSRLNTRYLYRFSNYGSTI